MRRSSASGRRFSGWGRPSHGEPHVAQHRCTKSRPAHPLVDNREEAVGRQLGRTESDRAPAASKSVVESCGLFLDIALLRTPRPGGRAARWLARPQDGRSLLTDDRSRRRCAKGERRRSRSKSSRSDNASGSVRSSHPIRQVRVSSKFQTGSPNGPIRLAAGACVASGAEVLRLGHQRPTSETHSRKLPTRKGAALVIMGSADGKIAPLP